MLNRLSPLDRSDLPAGFVLGLAMIFIICFSSFFLFDKSLRLDEAQSLWQTSHTLVGVLRIIAQDVHLPTYFISLRAWETVFGATPVAIRGYSLLFLVLSLPAFYALAKRAFGATTALITVALVASSPFLLWYGSEGRMYTLLLFFTLVNQLAFLKLWTRGEASGYWPLYILSALLGSFTHYFFLFIPCVQAIFYLGHRPLFARHALRNFLLTAGLVAVEYAGWLMYRSTVGKINADPYLARPSSIDVFNTFTNFVFGFQSSSLNTIFLSLWPILVLVACTLLVRYRSLRPEITYLLLSAFLPIALAFGVSISFRPLFLSRYLIVALPAIYLLLARLLAIQKRPLAYALTGTLVVFMQGALLLETFNPRVTVNENYREASHYLSVNARSDDLVVASAPFTRYPLEYYYRGQARLSTFPVWERYLELPDIPPYSETDLDAAVTTWKTRYRQVYVLTSYDQGYEEQLRLYLDHHLERLSEQEFSPGLNLYVYRLRYL